MLCLQEVSTPFVGFRERNFMVSPDPKAGGRKMESGGATNFR